MKIEDLNNCICGICGKKYEPVIITITINCNDIFTEYNYTCLYCGMNNYNKTIYSNEELDIFQPVISN